MFRLDLYFILSLYNIKLYNNTPYIPIVKTRGFTGYLVKYGQILPWRSAADVIDWSLPCQSIFDRTRPLADNTMKRIARGLYKFVIDCPDPYIVPDGQGGSNDRDNSRLVTAFLAQYHTERSSKEVRGQSLNEPLYTLDASNRYALVTSHIVKLRGTNIGQPVDMPLQTITAGGLHFGEVRAFLLKYYGAGTGQVLNYPLGTITSKDRFGLVTVHGDIYRIYDICMRMLQPRELFNAQGFPAHYIIDKDNTGRSYPKKAQVARCGNAVPPAFAAALIRANRPDLCRKAA